MEPGLGDREWLHPEERPHRRTRQAAMEPGLGDREWALSLADRTVSPPPPQWSPVLETGNGCER